MNKWLAGILLLLPISAWTQTAAIPVQSCVQGGVTALVSGLASTNLLQGVIPGCTVNIYLTGTTSPATYYFSQGGSPNTGPFTASPTGQFLIFAAQGQAYDIVFSGGIAPNVYASPLTITGIFAGGSGLAAVDAIINVKQLGAICDGVANDQAVIQGALNTYHNIQLPQNSNCASGPLVLNSGNTIYFNGATLYCNPSTIAACTVAGYATPFLQTTSYAAAIAGTNPTATGCSMTAGSNVLTCTSAPFTSCMIIDGSCEQMIAVLGANYADTVNLPTLFSRATVFTSSTQATLEFPALQTVSAATITLNPMVTHVGLVGPGTIQIGDPPATRGAVRDIVLGLAEYTTVSHMTIEPNVGQWSLWFPGTFHTIVDHDTVINSTADGVSFLGGSEESVIDFHDKDGGDDCAVFASQNSTSSPPGNFMNMPLLDVYVAGLFCDSPIATHDLTARVQASNPGNYVQNISFNGVFQNKNQGISVTNTTGYGGGLQSVTYVTGSGSPSGTGVCTGSALNNSSTGTITFTITSGVPVASIATIGASATIPPTSVGTISGCTNTASLTAPVAIASTLTGGYITGFSDSNHFNRFSNGGTFNVSLTANNVGSAIMTNEHSFNQLPDSTSNPIQISGAGDRVEVHTLDDNPLAPVSYNPVVELAGAYYNHILLDGVEVNLNGTTATTSGGLFGAKGGFGELSMNHFKLITNSAVGSWSGFETFSALANNIGSIAVEDWNLQAIASGTVSSGVTQASFVGGTLTGTGTCSLASFNNSCSGTTATFPVTSGLPGHFTITAAGTGCTANPTSATGTGACSGTITIDSSLNTANVVGFNLASTGTYGDIVGSAVTVANPNSNAGGLAVLGAGIAAPAMRFNFLHQDYGSYVFDASNAPASMGALVLENSYVKGALRIANAQTGCVDLTLNGFTINALAASVINVNNSCNNIVRGTPPIYVGSPTGGFNVGGGAPTFESTNTGFQASAGQLVCNPGDAVYNTNTSYGPVGPMVCNGSYFVPVGAVTAGTSLPATCVAASGSNRQMDMFAVFSGGTTTPYYCSATNTWTQFSGISGLTAGYFPLATAPNAIGANSPCDYNVTNAGKVTCSAGAVFSGPGASVLGAGVFESEGGTQFTVSGCSASAPTGNASAGTFTLGAASCNAVVTINGATGFTATGYHCSWGDRSASTTVLGVESASTANTATFAIPSGATSGDVISFGCVAFL